METITNIQHLDGDRFVGTGLRGSVYLWRFDCNAKPAADAPLAGTELDPRVRQVSPTEVFSLPAGDKIYRLRVLDPETVIMYRERERILA